MNLRKIVLVAVIFGLPAFAQAKTINVQVKGMVCAFCAQGVEKKFKAVPEVASVKVSLETKKVDLETKEGKDIGDQEIKKIISEAGYDVEKIERQK